MEELVNCDNEKCLYILKNGKFYSCLGYDVAYKKAKNVFMWQAEQDKGYTNITDILTFRVFYPSSLMGTQEGYNKYLEIMKRAQYYCTQNNVQCDIDLTPQLIGLEHKRVEVTLQDDTKRRFYVGKSTGWLPCHLEIARKNSYGGIAVMDSPFKDVRVIPGKTL